MDISNVASLLHIHSEHHHLEQRAHSGFKSWVDEAIREGATDLPVGWTYSELTAEFCFMCFWFRPPVISHPYVDTTLTIMRRGVPVGYYRLISDLEGNDEDDYFVIREATR